MLFNELEHYGVLGMKWGVRRYQNADGTLTEDGKKKLKAYKEKEYARVSKEHQKATNAYERARHRRKGKGLSTASKDEVYKKDIVETYKKELEFIKKMKFKDMQEDKRVVGEQFMKSSTGSTIMALSITALTGVPHYALYFGPILPSSISRAKTRSRMQRAGE